MLNNDAKEYIKRLEARILKYETCKNKPVQLRIIEEYAKVIKTHFNNEFVNNTVNELLKTIDCNGKSDFYRFADDFLSPLGENKK